MRALGLAAIALVGCGRIGFAPSGNGGTGDGAGTDGTPGACPAFAIACDDFESGSLSRWTGIHLQGPATVTETSARARSGSTSVEASVGPDAADGGRAAPYLRMAPRTTGVLAVRQFISLATTLAEFNLVAVILHHATTNYVAAGGNFSASWVSTEDSTGGQRDHHTTTPTPPLDTWTCVELVYTFPGATGGPRIQLYVEDAIVVDVPSSDPSPSYTEIQIGVARADLTGFRVFLDDVVIADRRIGCS